MMGGARKLNRANCWIADDKIEDLQDREIEVMDFRVSVRIYRGYSFSILLALFQSLSTGCPLSRIISPGIPRPSGFFTF